MTQHISGYLVFLLHLISVYVWNFLGMFGVATIMYFAYRIVQDPLLLHTLLVRLKLDGIKCIPSSELPLLIHSLIALVYCLIILVCMKVNRFIFDSSFIQRLFLNIVAIIRHGSMKKFRTIQKTYREKSFLHKNRVIIQEKCHLYWNFAQKIR